MFGRSRLFQLRIRYSADSVNQHRASFAANPFTEKVPSTRPNGKGTGPAPFNLNQGTVGVGGPIRKNKMFIFGDYQLGRQITGQTLTATLPTQA